MSDVVRWGIIGCGNVTEVKSGPAFQRVPGSALVAVMRRDAAKAKDYAERHGVARWYSDADALIADRGVDAIYIATPPGSHCELALRAAAAGKPTYVEKPMARDGAECGRMIDAFAAAGVPLFVAYYRRAMPRFLKVRDLLAAGVIGRLSGVAIRYAAPRHRGVDPEAPEWRLVPEVSGGGLFIDLGSHALDLIDFLAGPLDAVSGDALRVASPVPVEDVVSLWFRAGGEVLGVGFWNFASDAREDVLEFTGTEGRISLSCYGEEPILVAAGGRIEEIPAPYPQHVQEPMIRTVVDALLGRGECASTGETAARTQRVMDRAIAGFYGRGS